jgi:hypothetical protein
MTVRVANSQNGPVKPLASQPCYAHEASWESNKKRNLR